MEQNLGIEALGDIPADAVAGGLVLIIPAPGGVTIVDTGSVGGSSFPGSPIGFAPVPAGLA